MESKVRHLSIPEREEEVGAAARYIGRVSVPTSLIPCLARDTTPTLLSAAGYMGSPIAESAFAKCGHLAREACAASCRLCCKSRRETSVELDFENKRIDASAFLDQYCVSAAGL